MKKCSRCGCDKDESMFYRRKIVPSGRSGVCKQCEADKRKHWNIKQYHKSRNAVKRYRDKHRAYFLIRYARDRAQKLHLDFDLEQYREQIQERIDRGFCELTGFPLSLEDSRGCGTPSIDRIDPSRGYTYNNIRIICLAMNNALGNWGEEALYAVVVSWMRKRNGGTGKGNTGQNDGKINEKNQPTTVGVI